MNTPLVFKIIQTPSPLAALVGCHKHGDCIWATCDCNPRWHVNIYRDDDMIDYQDGFTSESAARKWIKANS